MPKMSTLFYIHTIFGIGIDLYFMLILLSIPSIFIWRRLFRKCIKLPINRIITAWATTILVTPLIYVGLITLLFFSISYHPTYNFDKEKWFADKEKRYELSENIIESKMLIGKTKSEVRQILGDEGNTNESNYWRYYLGFPPGFANIDPDVLDIEFKDEKVIRVGQHET